MPIIRVLWDELIPEFELMKPHETTTKAGQHLILMALADIDSRTIDIEYRVNKICEKLGLESD